jgi:hypothetical protein
MGALATDAFNRANEVLSAGANWKAVGDLNSSQIVSNSVQWNSPGNNATRYEAVTAPDDQYAKVTLGGLVAPSGEGVGPAVRMDTTGTASSDDNFYFGQVNTTESRLFKCVAGTFTQLGSDGAAFANGDVCQIQARGDQISLLKNGSVVIGPITDTSLTAGQFGIWASGLASTSTMDDWEGGDLGGRTFLLTRL